MLKMVLTPMARRTGATCLMAGWNKGAWRTQVRDFQIASWPLQLSVETCSPRLQGHCATVAAHAVVPMLATGIPIAPRVKAEVVLMLNVSFIHMVHRSPCTTTHQDQSVHNDPSWHRETPHLIELELPMIQRRQNSRHLDF